MAWPNGSGVHFQSGKKAGPSKPTGQGPYNREAADTVVVHTFSHDAEGNILDVSRRIPRHGPILLSFHQDMIHQRRALQRRRAKNKVGKISRRMNRPK